MLGKLPKFLILFILLIPLSRATDPLPHDAPSLLKTYELKHADLLSRYLTLEDQIDGLTPNFRKLLGDRKTRWNSKVDTKPNQLPDKLLVQVIITERKRLENETDTLQEWKSKPYLLNSYLRKMAAALLRLEASEILLSFTEYCNDFHRGNRPFPYSGKPANRLHFIRLGAATLLGFDYSAQRKSRMAFSSSWLLSLNPSESKDTLNLIEQGLGPMKSDALSLTDTTKTRTPADESLRLQEGQRIISLADKLTAAFSLVNKPFADEYQYRLMKLKAELESKKAK